MGLSDDEPPARRPKPLSWREDLESERESMIAVAVAKALDSWDPDLGQSCEARIRQAVESAEKNAARKRRRDAAVEDQTVYLEELMSEPAIPGSGSQVDSVMDAASILDNLDSNLGLFLRRRFLHGDSLTAAAQRSGLSRRVAAKLTSALFGTQE